MERMILMESDESAKMNLRRSLSNVGSNNYMLPTSLPFASASSLSQLFSDSGMATNYKGSYYQHPHHLYSSLSFALPYSSFSSSLHQPPLLPLPKKMVAVSKNNNNITMIKKKKKKATSWKAIKEVPEKKKVAALVNISEEEETGEEFFLSPPPSILPLPKLLLRGRPKATDDLRRLLHI